MSISGKKIDPLARERIVHFLTVGYSRRQIVALCGVCKRTVDKIAREEQFSVVGFGQRNDAARPLAEREEYNS